MTSPSRDPEAPPGGRDGTGPGEQAVVSGTRWVALGQFSTQVTRLAVSIVLARLLEPADFGLLAAAMVVVMFLDLFKDLGTGMAVIQRPVVTDGLLSAVFVVNLAIGVVLAGALAVASPLFAALLDEPRSVDVLRAMAPAVLLSSCGHVHQALLRRQMAFARIARISVGATIVGGGLSIVLAAAGGGVWALVAGTVAVSAISTVLTWWSSGWRPGRDPDWRAFREVAGFGVNVSAADFLEFLVFHADKVVVARYVGERGLGFYSFAQRLLMYPVMSFTNVVTEVLFPALARHQDDDAKVVEAYLRASAAVALVTVPAMVGAAIIARPLVLTTLGPKWEPVVPLVWILAPVGALESVRLTCRTLFVVKGRADLLLRWSLVSTGAVMAGYLVGVQWGLTGIAGAYAAVVAALTYPEFALALRLVGLRVRSLVGALRTCLLATAVMAAAVAVVRVATERAGAAPWLVVAATVGTGAAVYGGTILKVRPAVLDDLLMLLSPHRPPGPPADDADLKGR